MSLQWLETNFGSLSITARKAGTRYPILLFDSHNSHININFLDYCIKNRIIPVCLPPHTSYRLQPFDVSVFSPYKHAYQRELRSRFENYEVGVSKRNFYEIISHAWADALTQDNIRSCFWSAGIIPSDGEMILRQLHEEQAARKEGRQTRMESLSLSENRPLCDIELSEIAQLCTPQKPKELEIQVTLLLDDLQCLVRSVHDLRHV